MTARSRRTHWPATTGSTRSIPMSPFRSAVTPDSLTVKDANGNVVASGSSGYVTTNGTDRTVDLGAGSTARWAGAATLADGTKVDLVATIVSISNGDFVRFNRPTSGTNGDDPTFLLRDASNGNGTNGDGANVQILWQLVTNGTNTPHRGQCRIRYPRYRRRRRQSEHARGGQRPHRQPAPITPPNARPTSRSAPRCLPSPRRARRTRIRWRDSRSTRNRRSRSTGQKVSAFTINYSLAANNGVTTQAQFYQDGNADFKYSEPRLRFHPAPRPRCRRQHRAGQRRAFHLHHGHVGQPGRRQRRRRQQSDGSQVGHRRDADAGPMPRRGTC